jgi:hypothetical protein
MMWRPVTVLFAVGLMVLGGCGSDDGGPADTPASARVEIAAVAGPVCPVETDPPSPECAPRPVESAVMVVTDRDGDELTRGTTGPAGMLTLDVAPGVIAIVPQPVESLLGTASPVTIVAVAGRSVSVQIDYDTGIR